MQEWGRCTQGCYETTPPTRSYLGIERCRPSQAHATPPPPNAPFPSYQTHHHPLLNGAFELIPRTLILIDSLRVSRVRGSGAVEDSPPQNSRAVGAFPAPGAPPAPSIPRAHPVHPKPAALLRSGLSPSRGGGGGPCLVGVFCHLHLFIYRLRARRKAGPGKYLPAGSRSAASFTGFTASKALPQSLQISFHHFSCGLITRLAASVGLLSQVPLPLIAGIYYLNVSVCLLFPFWVR